MEDSPENANAQVNEEGGQEADEHNENVNQNGIVQQDIPHHEESKQDESPEDCEEKEEQNGHLNKDDKF